MAKQPKTQQKSTRTIKKDSTHAAGRKFRAGLYVAPQGNMNIAVPAFWTLRQTNDDIELEAPGGDSSVIVNAYQRNPDFHRLDAREYLRHFLTTIRGNGRATVTLNTSSRAAARFHDPEGDAWEAMFLSNGNTMLLATCNIHGKRTSKDAKVALEVLHSLKLKR